MNKKYILIVWFVPTVYHSQMIREEFKYKEEAEKAAEQICEANKNIHGISRTSFVIIEQSWILS
jgi:hypothetical protein